MSLLIAVSACFITSTKANTIINNDSSPPTVYNVANDLKENKVEISVMESMPVELSTYVFTASPEVVFVNGVIITKTNTVAAPNKSHKEGTNIYDFCSCPECIADRCSPLMYRWDKGQTYSTNYNYETIRKTNLTKTSAMAPVRYRIANSKVNLRTSSRV